MKTISCLLSFALLAVLGSASAQIDTVTGDGPDPSMGSLGTTLTIAGAGFGGPTGLVKPSAFLLDPMTLKKFALAVVAFSDTEITATVTKAAYGALDVNVQPKGGPLMTAASAFTVPDPEITGVAPLDESGTIGTTVTISGTGLLGVVGPSKPKVQLLDMGTGKKYALKVLTFSDTEVTAVITKAVAGTMKLQLLPKGGAAMDASAAFEVPLPNISLITPTFAFVNDTVTLDCDHVGNKKPKVKLGSKNCKVLTFSDTEVAFLMPKKLPKGVHTLQLINKVGTATQIGAIINQGDVPDTSTVEGCTATVGKIKFVAGFSFLSVLGSLEVGPPAVLEVSAFQGNEAATQTDFNMHINVPYDPNTFTDPVGFIDDADGNLEFGMPNPDVFEALIHPYLARWSSDAPGGSYSVAILSQEPANLGQTLARGAFSGTLKLVETAPGFSAADTVVVTSGEFITSFDPTP